MRKFITCAILLSLSWNVSALSLSELDRAISNERVHKALEDVQVVSVRYVERIHNRFFQDKYSYRAAAIIVCGLKPSRRSSAVDYVTTIVPANYAYDIFHDEIMQRVSVTEDPLCERETQLRPPPPKDSY